MLALHHKIQKPELISFHMAAIILSLWSRREVCWKTISWHRTEDSCELRGHDMMMLANFLTSSRTFLRTPRKVLATLALFPLVYYTVTFYVCDYRWGMDWWIDYWPLIHTTRNYE
jgi:hypothetical protein